MENSWNTYKNVIPTEPLTEIPPKKSPKILWKIKKKTKSPQKSHEKKMKNKKRLFEVYRFFGLLL